MKSLIKILDEHLENEISIDEESFKDLYKQFWDKMLRQVCMKYTNDINQAKDYCQSGWVKVYQKLDKFTGKGSVDGWISTVIRNTILDELRKRKIDYVEKEPEWGRLGKGQLLDPDAGSIESYNEEGTFETSEGITFDDVIQATKQLSPAYKEVFELYLQGYKHEEIAEKLGITVGTSKSNVFKAKENIKKMLKP
jgi:RNA polymerase sigma-70 factor (ECF subfamily)